jgi:hypothetical protein
MACLLACVSLQDEGQAWYAQNGKANSDKGEKRAGGKIPSVLVKEKEPFWCWVW